MALNDPPTYCCAGQFWTAWYFQMRKPENVCDLIDFISRSGGVEEDIS